jgi:membrane associated rhomboid family serine protease
MKPITNKAKQILLAYTFIFLPMWSIFLLKDQMHLSSFEFLGVHPRSFHFADVLGIMGSWMVHSDSNHIIGNSIGLVGLLFFIALFETRILTLFFGLILTSGISTWLLGAPNTVHIGASGLLFAMFGYILASACTGRRWIYFVPIIAAASYFGFAYYGAFLNGLMVKEDVSFAAHFGGLLSGILLGVYFEKEEKAERPIFKENFRDKWESFKWNVSYKVRNFRK